MVPPVFKTGERCTAALAGSIPVRLRYLRERLNPAAAVAAPGTGTSRWPIWPAPARTVASKSFTRLPDLDAFTLAWAIAGWRRPARYRRGADRCEVKLDAGGGDAFLLAGQQGQRAGIGRGGPVQV